MFLTAIRAGWSADHEAKPAQGIDLALQMNGSVFFRRSVSRYTAQGG